MSVKGLGHDDNHPSPFSGEVKNLWSYTSVPKFFMVYRDDCVYPFHTERSGSP